MIFTRVHIRKPAKEGVGVSQDIMASRRIILWRTRLKSLFNGNIINCTLYNIRVCLQTRAKKKKHSTYMNKDASVGNLSHGAIPAAALIAPSSSGMSLH